MNYNSVAASLDCAVKGGHHVDQTFDNLQGWPAVPATLARRRRLVRSKIYTNRTLEVLSDPHLLRLPVRRILAASVLALTPDYIGRTNGPEVPRLISCPRRLVVHQDVRAHPPHCNA